jgi:hypothetical protein
MPERDVKERPERAGFAAHRVAQDLRDVRERFPARDDLAARLRALEEEARTVAGLIATELHDIEEVAAHGGAA